MWTKMGDGYDITHLRNSELSFKTSMSEYLGPWTTSKQGEWVQINPRRTKIITVFCEQPEDLKRPPLVKLRVQCEV
jgi:hypothetical protein